MKTLHAPSILPCELIMVILLWLPVKILVRLSSVSKSWRSFIFDPVFVKQHLQRSPKNTRVQLTVEEEANICITPYSVHHLLEHPSSPVKEDECCHVKTNYWVCGSINGLVCLRGCHFHDEIEEYYVRFWNPAMRLRSKKSPIFRVNMPSQGPEPWKVNFGFGYDDSSDTYKVVAILWDHITKKMEGWIHCMGNNYWRKIIGCPSFPTLLEQIDGYFINGSVNWLALSKSRCHCCYEWRSVTVEHLVILSLDMRNETYTYLLLPDGIGEVPHVEPNLAILRGSLCLFHDHKKTHFVVWQMREFGVQESWTQLVKVSYEHLQCDYSAFPLLLPICLSENGDALLLANNEGSKVIVRRWRDNRMEYTQHPNNNYWLNSNDYVQSLVLPRPN